MSSSAKPPAPIRWAAEVAPVKEVTLLGSADLAFWQEKLRPAELTPAVHDGHARIMLCAVDAKFHGIPFRELSISVLVSRSAGTASDEGAYLLHAFNSSRLFACLERTVFETPYYAAGIDVNVGPPAAFRAAAGNHVPLAAAMGSDVAQRPVVLSNDITFQGPLFLPARRAGMADGEKYFVAKLTGATKVLAFDPLYDSAIIDPDTDIPALKWLAAAGFTPVAWHLRAAGRHAKSKTYRRAARDPWAA